VQQDHQVGTTLREIHAPSRSDVNTQLRNTLAHRLDIAQQPTFKSLDPGDDHAARGGIRQSIEPCRKSREWLYNEHSGW
jgi:hypothetical protein